MIEYLKEFYNLIGLNEKESSFYLDTYKIYMENSDVSKMMDDVYSEYSKNIDSDFNKFISIFKEISLITNTNEYTSYAILFSILSRKLKEYYIESNISLDIFYESMKDIRYKTFETYSMYNVYGLFCPEWYHLFYKLKRFSFGALQFEEYTYYLDTPYITKEVTIKKGDRVLNTHIPRRLKKLEYSEVKEAYKKASEFFSYYTKGRTIFICNSWMLFNRIYDCLDKDSNMYKFYKDYHIIENHLYEDYYSSFRVFNKIYNGNLDEMPNDTKLQRFYKELIKNKEPIGYAIGIFVYKK